MTTDAKTIAEQVDDIFCDCLFREDEIVDGTPPENAILVDGLIAKYGFHPDRVARHKEEVRALLDQMPDVFHAHSGGGMSFLNLCVAKDGHQWGEHRNMEQLVTLAIATGLGQYCMPREMWSMFPGGMPYVTFDTSK